MSSSKPRHGDPVVIILKNEFGETEGVPTRQFQQFLDELSEDDDSGDLDTDDLRQGITLLFSQMGQVLALNSQKEKDIKAQRQTISELQSRIGLLNSLAGSIKDLSAISVSGNFTTTGDQIIICTNTSSITITLNATPKDKEEVHIIRQNTGAVTVSGAINGDTSLTIGNRYSSPHLVFTLAANEWSII